MQDSAFKYVSCKRLLSAILNPYIYIYILHFNMPFLYLSFAETDPSTWALAYIGGGYILRGISVCTNLESLSSIYALLTFHYEHN